MTKQDNTPPTVGGVVAVDDDEYVEQEDREDEDESIEQENREDGMDELLVMAHVPQEVEDDEDEEKKEKKGAVYPKRKKMAYTSKDVREKTTAALSTKFKSEKNGGILEKLLYNAVIGLCKQRDIPLKTTNPQFQTLYAETAYTVLSGTIPLKELVETLKAGQIEWRQPRFTDLVRNREIEESGVTQDVEDGIHQCRACGSMKTKSTNIQLRSGDEGMTTFVKCVACGTMWKFNN